MQKSKGSHHPWYKDRWPWILMAGPILAVVAGIITFQIAVTTSDDMVSDDYYKRGKDINLELSRDKAAQSMGITAQAIFSEDHHSVRIMTSSRQPLSGELELILLHPTRQQDDRQIKLQKKGDRLFEGRISISEARHWYVRLQDKQGNWRVQGEWKPEEGNSLMLGNPKLEPVLQ